MSFISSRDRTLKSGIVTSVYVGFVDVQIGGSASVMRHIPVVGGTADLSPGDTVLLTEHEGKIYAHSMLSDTKSVGGTTTLASGGGGSGMVPHGMDYHTDERSWHAGLSGSALHDPKSHTHDDYEVVNGDTININWQPTNFTPDTSTAYADSVNHLTSILAGIDNAIVDYGEFSSEAFIVLEASDDLDNESVLESSTTIEVVTDTGSVSLDVILSENWSGLEDHNGIRIDTDEDFTGLHAWKGQHNFQGVVNMVGVDGYIWFNPIRTSMYFGAGSPPDSSSGGVGPAIDAALTVRPSYKDQSGLVVQRPWTNSEYSGNILRIIDENRNDLIYLTGEGNLQSGNPRYVSGSAGWEIAADGRAEFNDVMVRGEFRASVFVVGEQHVEGGTLMVLEGSALASAVTT